MPFIRAGGLVVHYRLEGQAGAPVVMLANPLGTNLHLWDGQMAALLPKYRVLRYDMRGHGLTDLGPNADYTIDDLADDAIALLDALKLGLVHFCGLSIGGMTGQKLGIKAGKQFLSLTLCNTALRHATAQLWQDRIDTIRQGGMAPVVEPGLQRWFTPEFFRDNPEIIQGFRNLLSRTPAAGYIGCCAALRDADLTNETPKIACPTLVVIGDSDLAAPPEAGKALARAIKGSRLVELKHCAHISAVEQPAALNAALTGFLDGSPG
jgi:3-oxoadipate enol-lactonase